MNRSELDAMRRRLADREAKEEPALIVWAAGILLAALAVIANFI